ncbi:hypothetical protein IWW50_002346, partial [Coemansia erecta]
MAGEDSTAPKRKRPMGLKARTAKKANTVTSAGAQEVADFADSTTATVMLRGEDANEIDELEGIFTSALEALAEGDDERSVTLLRGTVHESDRLLRIHDTSDERLEPRFYYIYASALFRLSEHVSDADERRVFVQLALERIEQAREMAVASEDAILWQVYMALAKFTLEVAAEAEEEGEAVKGVDRAIEALDNAVCALEKQGDASLVEESLAAADLVLSLADSQRLPEQPSARLVAWGELTARKLVEKQSNDEGGKCILARALWLRASAMIDDTDEIREKDVFASLLKEAALLLEKVEASDGLLLLGEIEINLGNVQDDEAEMEKWYTQAVATFRRAQAKGE